MDFPILMPRVKTTRHSGLIFHWRGSDLTLASIAGQTATFARTGIKTQTDTEGETYSAIHSQPRWHWNSTLEKPTLRFVDADLGQLMWAMNTTPREMTVYVSFVYQSFAAGDVVIHLGHETAIATTPFFAINRQATGFSVSHNNGTNRTATAVCSPSGDDSIEILAHLEADGGVEIEVSINEGASATASDGTANTLAAAWAGPYLHVNGVVASNLGAGDYRILKIAPGDRTLAEMRKAF